MSDAITKAIQAKAKHITVGSGDAAVELLRVEPGTFTIGAPEGEAGWHTGEGPPQTVTITKAFYLGRCPVTQKQYEAVTGKNPGKVKGPDLAIDQLTYAEAVAYCELLAKAAGVAVTLPTEAQWEYACRAGTKTRFWTGDTDDDLGRVGWFRDNSGKLPNPVGKKPANPWGFHDVHGNVCEFCLDNLVSYQSIPEVDPVGRRSKTEGIMRGGGYMHSPDYCRSACRLVSSDMFGGAGLRIALPG